jgi:2'-5' RNA ligase
LRETFPRLRVSWDKPEKLHLTLKFLGDSTDEQVEKLKSIIQNVSGEISNFELEIARTGVFPNPRNARVLWIDVVDEKGNLAKINRILENECEKIGFPKEKRAFKPHLTIARLREPEKSRELAQKHLQTIFEPVRFDVSDIVIYESKLRPAGSVYEKLASFKLKPETAP